MHRLLATGRSWGALIVRLGLGIVFFPHGAQKVFGWFGGQGLSGTLDFLTGSMGVPLPLALLVIAAESLGSIGLIAGCLTRVAALGILCNMTGAIFLVHLPHGFFMNWFGTQGGEGFEYHLLAIAMSLALLVEGGGRFSVDGVIAARMHRHRA